MIIWVASYPRSGNSLLRQVLYLSLGYASYTELREVQLPLGDHSRYIDEPFEEFCRRAADTEDPVFVKTHLPPIDERPALYAVRDGRAALTSFARFEATFSADSRLRSPLALVLGLHHFGSWSEHYRVWHGRGDAAPILTLEYGELFAGAPQTLERIAAFVGHKQPVIPWANPIERMRAEYPEVIGKAAPKWLGDDLWDPVCDAVFWRLHGELMRELDLDDGQRIGLSGDGDELLQSIIPTLHGTVEEVRELRQACRDKEAVIAELRDGNAERLRLIAELTSACEERLGVIEDLRRAVQQADSSGQSA
jgi:hypothetical protein